MNGDGKMDTPTLDKMKEVHEESQAIGTFLDTMSEQGYCLCQHHNDGKYVYRPVQESFETILAQYFKIDLKEAEKERQAILDEFVASQQ